MTKKPKTSKDAADKVAKNIRLKTRAKCPNICTGYTIGLIGALTAATT